jgi:hypothetical protein
VCGGWAIDLFVDEVTRPHEDLEVGIFRHHQLALRRAYPDWSAFAVIQGGQWDPWNDGDYLELPVHQVLLRKPGSPDPNPWEPTYELDRQFFLNDSDQGIWVSRRDSRIRLHVRELALRSPSGVPVVAPEVQLLYKARHAEEKNEHDFELVEPHLGGSRRTWLREALELVHPGHRWIQALA